MTIANSRRHLRLAIPLAILAPLIGIMVGCIYIPTWERVDLGGTRSDFRPMTRAMADHPIVIGQTTRADVEKFLGPPPFSTDDGHHVVYVIQTHRGFWTAPLCLFTVNRNAHTEQIGLDLIYQPDGAVKRWQILDRAIDQGPPGIIDEWGDPFGGPTGDQTAIIRALNHEPDFEMYRGDRPAVPPESRVPPAEFLRPRTAMTR